MQDNREGITPSKFRLFTVVTNQTIQQCTEFIDKVREDRFNMVRDRQVGKFLRLLNKSSSNVEINNSQQAQGNLANSNNSNNYNNVVQSSNNNLGYNVSSRWVVNLSSTPLTQAQVSLLSKGPNFAPAPTNPTSVEFISAVEVACQRLPEQDAQELRAEVNILLKRAKPPKSNFTKEEKKAPKELREDQDRMVLTVDKRVAMVVMDRKEYQEKVENLLASTAYKTIPADPTNKIKVQLIQKLRTLKRETNMDEGMYRIMYPTSCTAQSFMGYQKSIKQVPP